MTTIASGEGSGGTGPGGVPVLSVDIGKAGPVLSHFDEWDEFREQCPAFWNDV